MFQSSFSRAVLFLLLSSFSIQEVTGQRGCPELTCTPSKTFDKTTDLDEYYSSTEGLNCTDLKKELNKIIRKVETKEGEVLEDHYKLKYTPCVWVALAEADADPNIAGRVIGLYTNNSFALLDRDCGSRNQGLDVWNREHVWAKSHGFPNQDEFHAYSDLHHLFAADKSINNDNRGNYDFKSSVNTFENNNEDNNIICDDCKTDEVEGTFEPPDYVKGRIARAMLYMDTRYDGEDGTGTPNLTLVNRATVNGAAEFGFLSELLKWHYDNEPTQEEKDRNGVVQTWQGNRNPFVDRPDFVERIWDENCADETDPSPSPENADPSPSPENADPSPSPENADPSPSPDNTAEVWINEFHYDNVLGDRDEFVEVGCNANVDLTGYQIFLYNGRNGRFYDEITLSGIEAQCSPCGSFVVQNFENGIQNGAPDGIALIDSSGAVVEFISYEGSFLATDGPANGQTSVDIGVSETFSTPTGHSLQLEGEGRQRADFTWQTAKPSTKGTVNVGQTLLLVCPEVWINEFHYDNNGKDENEFVEIGCNTEVDVTDYQIVKYNGKNGKAYDSTLTGLTFRAVCSPPNEYPILKISQEFQSGELQNGNPGGDGIALIDSSGSVVEFISYEGSFEAMDGPAEGETSVDVGVSEESKTMIGMSLQLVGEGCRSADFTWQEPAESSEGRANVGQKIVCGSSFESKDEL